MKAVKAILTELVVILVNYWLVKDSYQKKHRRDQPNPV